MVKNADHLLRRWQISGCSLRLSMRCFQLTFCQIIKCLPAFLLIAVMSLTFSTTAAYAQDSANQENSTKTDDAAVINDPDQTLFFAFLQENSAAAEGPLVEIVKDKPLIRDFIKPRSSLERKFRPMLQMRTWANKKQRFLPSFAFLCLIGFICWWIFPTHLQSAVEECRKSFWKCFGAGLLISMIAMTVVRAVFLTQIGWPLAILLVGLSEGAMLVGLSLSVYNLGHAVTLISRINKIPLLATSPAWARAIDIVIGAFLSSLLLLIPAFGNLPRCGTRLLALFAVLGLGAIYKELKNRRQQSSP
jgi:hypothetical protein